MCGNTQQEILEVCYGKTSQHNKGLLILSSQHFTEYRTKLKHISHGGFQTLDREHQTDSRHLLDQPPGTTTETDEDGDGRRRRQTKTEADEDEDRLTLGTSEVAAPLQLTTTQSDEDGT